jgi:anthranilate phosphoribosyltransferase
MAHVLQGLDSRAACVVHGHGGLDELTTTGPNRISYFGIGAANGEVVTETLDPQQLGFRLAAPADLQGGDPARNAAILRQVLAGADRGPRRDVVLLNAAAALWVGGAAVDLEVGVVHAAHSIDSRAALRCLESLIGFSQRLAA